MKADNKASSRKTQKRDRFASILQIVGIFYTIGRSAAAFSSK